MTAAEHPTKGGTMRRRVVTLTALTATIALLVLSGLQGLGAYKPFQPFQLHNAQAVLPGGDNCTETSDFFNDFSYNGEIGIQMHIQCPSSALIKGTIACIKQWLPYYGSWGLGECWSGQAYGVLVLGGFQRCYSSIATNVFEGSASFNVTFHDGFQWTYSPVTAERGILCSIF